MLLQKSSRFQYIVVVKTLDISLGSVATHLRCGGIINSVNLGAVTFEITFLIYVPSFGYWAKIGLRSPFVAQ